MGEAGRPQSTVKEALAQLREMRARLQELERERSEPIAVVGLAGRFPGEAADADALWTLLHERRDAITEVPRERWDVDAFYDSDPEAAARMSTRRGGFLPDVDRFDAHFFGVSPREAVSMDPQQRLLLETSWRALEHAAIAPSGLAGSQTGVFIGFSNNDYYRMVFADRERIDAYYGSGTSGSVAAGRLSYALGLRGPSMVVDTACSSSLVAVHLACASLRHRECALALAGGVNLILTPDINIACSKARMMAPDGLCKTFDARADGYVRSEGCGVVVLKRLSDAEREGDRILALLRGSAVNQDGRSGGLTVPNGPAQEAVIRAALAAAGVEPADLDYVEAHGTGTSLGDPIEVRALGKVFGPTRPADRPLIVGAVKANVGHLEAAAGITGLIKVVLALQREEIPGHPHLGELNPHLDWKSLPIRVPAAGVPWTRGAKPRVAGISSFGFSGTNAHLVVEEAPGTVPAERRAERTRHLLALSARTDEALGELAASFEKVLERSAPESVGDICATANAGRSHFMHRLAVAGASTAEIARALADAAAGRENPQAVRGVVSSAEPPEAAFLFTGQGAQYSGMGRVLYDSHPGFRETLERCDALLAPELGASLLSAVFDDGAAERLKQTAFAQPALFAFEYALAQLWMSWGVRPAAVMGHSVGELVAACIAGVFTLEDGLKLIAVRGRLMQALPDEGEMLQVSADEAAVRRAIAGHEHLVSIGALNGPDQTVISGARAAVRQAAAALAAAGAQTREIGTSRAFHSPLMDPILDEFARAAAALSLSQPRVSLVSNLTGSVAGADVATAGYWRRHVREPVRFQQSIETLRAAGHRCFIEIGPHPALLGLARRFADAADVTWLPSLRRNHDDWSTLLGSLGSLYAAGADIDWAAFDRPYARRRVAVPGYPFQRERYWIEEAAEPQERRAPAGDAASVHPLLGRPVDTPLADVIFENRVGDRLVPFIADHRVFGALVFPATGYLEMAAAAGAHVLGTDTIVEDLVIAEPLAIPDGEDRAVQAVLSHGDDRENTFRVFSRAGGDEGWRLHASATLRKAGTSPGPAAPLTEAEARCREQVAASDHYEVFSRGGLEYGPTFRGIAELRRTDGEAVGTVRLPDGTSAEGYQLHPGLLDSCFHLIVAALPKSAGAFAGGQFYLPVRVERLRVFSPAGTRVRAHATLRPVDGERPEAIVGDVLVYAETGELVARIDGLVAKRASAGTLRGATRSVRADWLYEVQWQPRQNTAAARPDADLAGAWVLFGCRDGLASEIRRRLERAGASVTLVEPGSASDADAVVARATEGGGKLTGIAHLWNAEPQPGGDVSVEGLNQELRRHCTSLVHVVKAASAAGASPRLWVVTRGATGDGPEALSQAPLLALTRTIGAEHPAMACVALDLDARPAAEDADRIWREIAAPDEENQVAFGGGTRRVARLERYARPHADARAGERSVQLTIGSRGILDQLRLEPLARRAPGPGEVELRVAAAGLNFRDVLNALGMYPGDPGALGNECVGTVTAVGDGVDSLQVGQAVLGTVLGGFRSFAVAPADWLIEKPATLGFEDAATIPMAFLTAEYALTRLAGVKSGERVLIHAAAGGVGMAAVQIARRAGAEIFATVGSAEKRAAVEAAGVTHVFNSRTLDFAEQIAAATGGEGIDVVLNSLTGEFIPKSLGLLRSGGRFLEIGKRGIWTTEQVAAARPDVSYFPIFLGDVEGALIQAMLRDLMAGFAAGELQPLPKRVFALADAANAFRYMAQARHIGKVVLSTGGAAGPGRGELVRPGATYLITGGAGGLGLEVARLLSERGATQVVLTSRRPPSERALQTIADIERAGTKVAVVSADVSAEMDVAALFDMMDRELPPLDGVVHAAGVIEDGLLDQQPWEAFARVLAPKVNGAWHLHRFTDSRDLSFFVLFSSTAAVLPSPGQGNYATANAFLDALARYRRGRGLPAVSINWGPWAGVGMAAGLGEREQRRWARHGVRFIEPQAGLAAFERLLDSPSAQVAVLAADWRTFARESGAGRAVPLLASLAAPPSTGAPATAGTAGAALAAEIAAAPEGRRRDLVLAHVRDQVRQVLALAPDFAIAPHQGLTDIGMDSLMALELRNRLQRSVGRPLSATLTFDCPTVAALTDHIAKLVLPDAAPAAQGAVVRAEDARAAAHEPIAVIGLGCRFPGGASDPERYWRMLRDGVDAISEIPRERWDVGRYFDPDPERPGKMYTRFGGFIGEVDRFDPHFFGISPREAISLDPQQRLMLEVSWEALEHAGQSPERLLGTRSGVFVGIGTYDYAMLQMKQPDPAQVDAYFGTGTSLSVAAGRIAYSLGLQGPCMAVDTACSSSLVAIHLACRSLREGDCRVALAGGVNLMLTPEPFVNGCRARMLAPDGRCKTFDARADGYARAEGAGVVVLKRLGDAIADGDRVLAVIRGSAVNQDGRSSGLTVPNGPSQQAVIRDALADAGADPRSVGYLEAHGTGTALGDPIELQALKSVLCEDRPGDRPLVVGSVKTNIGHLEAAAGVAALMKVILALQHGEIPPHLHFETVNPHIELGDSIVIPREPREWRAGPAPRLAGVSSFGFSGTNAHVVVEEPPAQVRQSPAVERPIHLLALSARSDEALRMAAARHAEKLAESGETSLADAAFTLNCGRAHFARRFAVVSGSRDEAREALAAAASGATHPAIRAAGAAGETAPQVAFLFTGQGSQYSGMGRTLYETQPVFREALDRCDALLRAELDPPLLSVVYGSDPQITARLDQTAFTQPALFAIEYALAQLWMAWGLRPFALMGHSVGEYVAACVAGVFSLEDGLKLIAARARLMQALPPGAMAAVFAAPDQVRDAIAAVDTVSIAARNGPDHLVISGEHGGVDRVVSILSDRGVRTQRLTVSHAFHSASMDPILDEFERVAERVAFSAPQVPIASNLTGAVAGAEIATPAYWRRHVREAVRFDSGVRCLRDQGCTHFLEVGPKPTLLAMARRCEGGDLPALSSLRPPRDEWAQMLDSLAALYVAGAPVDWTEFDRPYNRAKVALPTYPFQRQRYWLDGTGVALEQPVPGLHELADTSGSEASSDLTYEVAWVEADQAPDGSIPARPAGSWLICSDRGGVGAALARELRARGAACAELLAGRHEKPSAPWTWHIDPSDRESYGRVFREMLSLCSQPLAGVVHLWSLDLPAAEGVTSDAITAAHMHGVGSVVHLVQALTAVRAAAPVHLVTRGAVDAPLAGRSHSMHGLLQAPVWGLGRALAVEHPELWGALIDLDDIEPDVAAAQLLGAIQGGAGEDQLALRDGSRYVPRLLPGPANEASFAGCRPDATYLVTGGLGELGLHTARWLASHGARHLLLVGRHGLPPREQWPSQSDPDVTRRLNAVRSLEAEGVTVTVIAADIADERQVEHLLGHLRESMPPLRGIVHAAGAYDGCRLHDMTAERLQSMLRAKVSGGWLLDRLTREEALDFFVMFSSISAVLGTIDLGHYAAANSFLDALAGFRRASGRPALSVNWGPWEGLRGSVDHQRVFARSGMRFLAPVHALNALARVMAHDDGQAVIASVEWSRFKPIYEAKGRRPFLDRLNDRAAEPRGHGEQGLLQQLQAADPESRRALLASHVRIVAGRVLGLDPREVDPRKGLFDLGMDSLMSVELKRQLESSFGLELPATLTFKYPTVTALAAFLDTKLGGEAPGTPVTPPASRAEVDEISEEELAARLATKLAQLR